jgi:hypothetical protein
MVFDDAVVHDRHPIAGDVGMGVAFAGRAMRRPPRMREPERAVERGCIQRPGQHFDLADGPHPIQSRGSQHHDTGGIVAAILEPPQSFEQDGGDVALRNSAHDAAHGSGSLCKSGG